MTTSMADYSPWSHDPPTCVCGAVAIWFQSSRVWECPACGRDCTPRLTATISGTCPQSRPQFVSENRP